MAISCSFKIISITYYNDKNVLFGKMNVVVDVVDTEAVVAHASGAVTEFQSRIFGVGASADRAFVMVKLVSLFLTNLLGFSAKVDGRIARSSRQKL